MELQIMKLKEIIEIQKDRNHVFSNIWNPESSNRWGGGEESDGGRRQCSDRVYEEARTKRMAFPANLKKAMKVEGGFYSEGRRTQPWRKTQRAWGKDVQSTKRPIILFK